MFIAPDPLSRRAAVRISYPLIDIDERFLTPPATFFGTLRRLPASEIGAGIAFAGLMGLLLIALAVFS